MKTAEELKSDGILREHNFKVYQEIEEMFEKENRVALVQATGTGKSFVAIQWLFDNCLLNGKKVLYLTAYNTIKDQFNKNIEEVSIDKAKAFKNMDELLYQKLLQVDDVDFETLKYDYIILDEFHRVGAEKWENAVRKLLSVNKNAKVLGLSATPIRFLDSGRDMATEIFDSNVVEGLTLAEAIEKGVLPKPEYHYGIYSLYDQLQNLEEKKKKIKNKVKREEIARFLGRARKMTQQADGLEEIFAKNIKVKDGRYILFCSNLEQVKEIKERIESGLFNAVNENIELFEISYTQSSKMVLDQIDKFEKAKNNSLKLMLAVDMLNEGVHVKDVDGCVMFRNTISPRIYLQQIGRVLSVGTKKTPVIFDISNNIKSLQTIADIFIEKDKEGVNPYKLEDYLPFKIDSENMEIYKLLARIDEIASFYSYSTEEWLDMAKRYAEKFGNLKIPVEYIDEITGAKVYGWIRNIRNEHLKGNKEVESAVKKLLKIDNQFLTYTQENARKEKEEKILQYVKEYYANEHNKGKTISKSYKVKIANTSKEFNLGQEIINIKQFLKGKSSSVYSQKFIEELKKIDDAVLKTKEDSKSEKEEKILQYVKEYYADEHNKGKTIPTRYKVKIANTNKEFNLGQEINFIRQFLKGTGRYVYSQEFIEELKKIDSAVLKTQEDSKSEKEEKILQYVKEYYADEHNKGKTIPASYKVKIANTSKEFNLGWEIINIKKFLKGKGTNVYSQELIEKLKQIDSAVLKTQEDSRSEKEDKILQYVKEYYADKHNKGKTIPTRYKVKIANTDKEFNLGQEISYIKLFLKGTGQHVYSQEFIEELKKIDSAVLKGKDDPIL